MARQFISPGADALPEGVSVKLNFGKAEAVRVFGLRLLTGVSSLEEVTAVVVESAFIRLLLLDSQGVRPIYQIEPRGYGVISDGASQLSMIEGGAFASINEVMRADDVWLQVHSNIVAGLQFDVIVEYEEVPMSDLKATQLAWGL